MPVHRVSHTTAVPIYNYRLKLYTVYTYHIICTAYYNILDYACSEQGKFAWTIIL